MIAGAALAVAAGAVVLGARGASAGQPVPPPAGALVVGTAGPDCPSPSYSTIQSAVDAAGAGATIYVCAGTYQETLTIAKPLVLDGAQYDVDARGRGGSVETVLTGGGITYAAGATSGTVNGFTLEDYSGTAAPVVAEGVGAGWQFVNDVVDVSHGGIALDTDGAVNPLTSRITNDLFVQATPSAALTGDAGVAVAVTGGTAANVVIAYNSFENLSGPDAAITTPGTGACGAALDSTNFSESDWVVQNTMVEDGASFTDPTYGPGFVDESFLDLQCSQSAHVRGNTVTVTDAGDAHAKTAIDLTGGNWSTVVQVNSLHGDGTGAAAGIDVNSLDHPAGTGVEVLTNVVSGWRDGIDVESGGSFIVDSNTVSSSAVDGIAVQSTSTGGGSLTDDAVSGSATADCFDATTGAATASTADSWVGDGGATSSPAGLCAVFAAPTITSPASLTGRLGSPVSFTVTSTGYPTAALAVSPLPAGLTFTDGHDGTGTITGAPLGAVGTHKVTIRAQNTTGTTPNGAKQILVLEIDKAPAITSAASRNAVPGSAFSFSVTTSGYPHPALRETGALPPGVTFSDTGTGKAVLSGTPTGPLPSVTWPVTITATNSAGTSTQSFLLTTAQVPQFTSPMKAAAVVGVPFSYTIRTSSYLTPALAESGALPAGILFTDNHDGTATISGTAAIGSPRLSGLTITATTVSGTTSRYFALATDTVPAFTSAPGASAAVGKAFSFVVKTSGVPAPRISESGALPAGVTFLNGTGKATLTGTPTASGSWPVTFTATSAAGTVTQSFTLTVG